jgi:hypothetical protein
MKQNKTEPFQVCFLSTYDIVNKDKDRIVVYGDMLWMSKISVSVVIA